MLLSHVHAEKSRGTDRNPVMRELCCLAVDNGAPAVCSDNAAISAVDAAVYGVSAAINASSAAVYDSN